jgi:glycosyltransferase involved in cell wall biosynthesis
MFLDYLAKGLVARGHEVWMWIPNHPRMDELAAKCGGVVRIVRADYRNTYDYAARSLSTCFNWGVSERVAREWQAIGPDVIHINKQNLEDGLDLLRAAQLSGCPSICTIHLTQTARYLRARAAPLRDWIARWQLSKYEGIFVAVQEHRRSMLDAFLANQGRTQTIFNGVPSIDNGVSLSQRELKRGQLGLEAQNFLVLGVGRLVEQKRPFLFLRIAKELHSRFPQMRFLWVGDGKLAKEWEKVIVRERLEKVVSCAGWQADVLPFLAASDLLLHVAEFEGLPFVVLEAMAAQLACAVTSDLSGEVPQFNSGNVLFADDVKSLATMLENPSILRRIAEKGRCLVEDTFSVRKMAESYEQLYRKVRKERALSQHVESI